MPSVKVTFTYRGWEDDLLIEEAETLEVWIDDTDVSLLGDLSKWLKQDRSRFGVIVEEE